MFCFNAWTERWGHASPILPRLFQSGCPSPDNEWAWMPTQTSGQRRTNRVKRPLKILCHKGFGSWHSPLHSLGLFGFPFICSGSFDQISVIVLLFLQPFLWVRHLLSICFRLHILSWQGLVLIGLRFVGLCCLNNKDLRKLRQASARAPEPILFIDEALLLLSGEQLWKVWASHLEQAWVLLTSLFQDVCSHGWPWRPDETPIWLQRTNIVVGDSWPSSGHKGLKWTSPQMLSSRSHRRYQRVKSRFENRYVRSTDFQSKRPIPPSTNVLWYRCLFLHVLAVSASPFWLLRFFLLWKLSGEVGPPNPSPLLVVFILVRFGRRGGWCCCCFCCCCCCSSPQVLELCLRQGRKNSPKRKF